MSDEKPLPSTNINKDIDDEEQNDSTLENMRKFFAEKLSIFGRTSSDGDGGGETQKVIPDLTFDGLTKHWKNRGFKNIITMVGAGISTSAGIPDFRSPGSGLYDNLQKYNLPHPSAIFEMDYFHENPQPFFALAKELYPGTFNPTPSHYFVKLLHTKGLLLRHYTQNIDTLERIADIPANKLVEAHGTFYTNHCLGCRELYSMEWMKEEIFSDRVPICTKCNSVVKPDIVFFGENLPESFYKFPANDFAKCDLLIIMGTSLEVQPFASLVDHAGPNCIRLLINRTKVGHNAGSLSGWFLFGSTGLQFDSESNTRDIAYIGDCDDGIWALTEALGWTNDLKKLIENDKKRLAKKNNVKEKKNKKNAKQENEDKRFETKNEVKEEKAASSTDSTEKKMNECKEIDDKDSTNNTELKDKNAVVKDESKL